MRSDCGSDNGLFRCDTADAAALRRFPALRGAPRSRGGKRGFRMGTGCAQRALWTMLNALKGESAARFFFGYLLYKAPDEDVDTIMGIREEDLNHLETFRRLIFELTGRRPPANRQRPFCQPASYCDGLQTALLAELQAAADCRNILFAMQKREHIDVMAGIITDKLRHAGLFNYLYAKNGCGAQWRKPGRRVDRRQ